MKTKWHVFLDALPGIRLRVGKVLKFMKNPENTV
jgi:hypothetical protein